ncbi:glycosyltransferase [Cognataquiflexum rubidum]|uniref:glycosyltransferase n=1 Tax=Cognataquiflexum rubidum TaxID=2922273 RepID=UPI001F137DF7|nr:glycosyltransferase [Cognataquiflexum rubidum]MCH6234050.1 glycosyltransferase [Cognataquiflexum rubidum]
MTKLVSVIIPCYNHGKYLSDAINSVMKQSYQNIEIIVVDDGSIDDTKEITSLYPKVKYIYQENQGLSAARNKGILNSHGDYLVFLDADDLLYFDSIDYQLKHLLDYPEVAFVSGAHQMTTIDGKIINQKKERVSANHYEHFLKGNYIGMHATVMYRKFVFGEFQFDESLKACEDYDMYLNISRKYPVLQVPKILALYRKHENNMSANSDLMLRSAVEVLSRQKEKLASQSEILAYRIGLKGFKNYYSYLVYNELRVGSLLPTRENIKFLKKNNPALFFSYILSIKVKASMTHNVFKKLIPEYVHKLFYNIGFNKSFIPKQHKINLGDFNRLNPFSKTFGYDRGGPIDRYYIEEFLKDSSIHIQGRVLEIGDNEYTLRYGKEKVRQSEILHVNESNAQATIIGDLSDAPQIADNSFDCIILTQTLHLVYDYKAVIRTCYRILKPGGIMLLTVPGITPIDYEEWGNTWYWSFTGLAIEKILSEVFNPNHTKVQTFGNVYVATAFLYGMGLPEVKQEKLEFNDPQMQVIVTAKAIKEPLI